MVLHIVNSTFGRKSNIAYRTSKIAETLHTAGLPYEVFCRKSDLTDPRVHSVLPGGDVLPRILNATRMFLLPSLPSRRWDNRFFCAFVKRKLSRFDLGSVMLVHLWEPLPELIGFFHGRKIPVLLEVPIAPATYGRRLVEKGLQTGGRLDLQVETQEKEAFCQADHILVPSEFVRDLVAKEGTPSSKISIIPFGADPIADSISYPDRSPIAFAFAGTFNSRKGADILIEAWKHPEFHSDELHICGHVYPEYRPKLRQAGFGKIVTPGFISTRDYLRGCHVYVFPSLMEGSAKSIYEAMSLGMPIITTPAAGSIVEDGKEGFIVDIGDSAALRERMLYFKNNPDSIRRMGEAAKRKVARYPWSRYGDSVVKVYEALAAGR